MWAARPKKDAVVFVNVYRRSHADPPIQYGAPRTEKRHSAAAIYRIRVTIKGRQREIDAVVKTLDTKTPALVNKENGNGGTAVAV